MSAKKSAAGRAGKAARSPGKPQRSGAKPRNIDEYLAQVSPDKRAALENLRNAIHSLVPEAEECLSYGLPAFRLGGRPLVAFGAAAHHCAFYPMSSATIGAHEAELRNYETSKGTIRFPADDPLPTPLLRKLIKARIAEARASRQ